jgi:cytochrome c oxidase subunit 3
MNLERSGLQINLAKSIVIISMAMLFATLFMGYAIYRSSAISWPPMGTQRVPLTLPGLSTLLIFVSSFFCHNISKQVIGQKFNLAHRNLNLTLALGLGFMISQSILWNQMKGLGLLASSGIFASLIYAFTWIHFAHMVAGILGLLYLKKILQPQTVNLLIKAKSIEHFWYFLEIVWLIMFVTLFVF